MAANHSMDFQFLAEHSLDILCRTATDSRLLYVSPSCLRTLGWTPQEMTGRTATEYILNEDLAEVKQAIARCNAPGVHGVTTTIRFVRKDGAAVWMEVNARAVRDDATGEPIEHVIVMRDVTERKLLEEQLSRLAMVDSLTGLANRRAFDDVLDREWKRTLRSGSQVSLLLLDIDHFKAVNDQYGHPFGDDCLRAVAVAVLGTVRTTDTAARYGGEEIAVVLPDCDLDAATEIAERMRLAVEGMQLKHQDAANKAARLTVSIGIATALARQGGSMRMPESLVLAADNALYSAKRAGRNRLASSLLMAQQSN